MTGEQAHNKDMGPAHKSATCHPSWLYQCPAPRLCSCRREAGVRAAALTGNLSSKERVELLRQHREGELEVMT